MASSIERVLGSIEVLEVALVLPVVAVCCVDLALLLPFVAVGSPEAKPLSRRLRDGVLALTLFCRALFALQNAFTADLDIAAQGNSPSPVGPGSGDECARPGAPGDGYGGQPITDDPIGWPLSDLVPVAATAEGITQ